jgi:hypothetical protein
VFQEYEYPGFPPETVTVAVPVHWELQATLVWVVVAVSAGGWVMETV